MDALLAEKARLKAEVKKLKQRTCVVWVWVCGCVGGWVCGCGCVWVCGCGCVGVWGYEGGCGGGCVLGRRKSGLEAVGWRLIGRLCVEYG